MKAQAIFSAIKSDKEEYDGTGVNLHFLIALILVLF